MLFYFDLLIMLGIYALLAVGLDILMGFTGILCIGHAAFFGIGAYVAGLSACYLGLEFVPTTLLAMLVAGSVGVILAFPVMRVSGDFLLLLTLGFGEIVQNVFVNWSAVTGGAKGLSDIPSMKFLNLTIYSDAAFCSVEYLIIGLCFFLLWRLKRSALGQILKGIRDDDLAMQVLGFNTFHYKVLAFFLAGSLAGLAGSFFAFYRSYINPASFCLELSVLFFCTCVIGGLGTLWGSLAGAVLFWTLPEFLRLLGGGEYDAAAVRQLALGLILILVMIWRPSGLIGERRTQY